VGFLDLGNIVRTFRRSAAPLLSRPFVPLAANDPSISKRHCASSSTGVTPSWGLRWSTGPKGRPWHAFSRLGAFAGILMFLLAGSGCHAQAPAASGREIFPPAQTRELREFGAVGDGRADDTAAVQRAFANSDRYCLDGGSRTYRVTGTLKIEKNVCLRNITLVQSLAPFDTRPYVRASCPVTTDPNAVVDCGDPALRTKDLEALKVSLSVRTLLIRPGSDSATVRVLLDHVKVDRGHYPELGSRTDSAGIWLQGASGADLRNVEITGYGKGYGLIVLRSRDVAVDRLWIHDLLWAPYSGDTPLVRAQVAAIGWNTIPIHEFRKAGEDGVAVGKFYGVRVQEQLTCALFSEVHNVTIRNARISHCMAKFVDGNLPWQADGLDISHPSSDIVVDSPVIDSTWEGMDVLSKGGDIVGLQIRSPKVSNSFGFGLKLGNQLRDPSITGATITNAGIAGIVIYGGVEGASIKGATITGVGVISAGGRTFVPWPEMAHSGIRIDDGPSGTGNQRAVPRNVDIQDVDVSNGAGVRGYAILSRVGTLARVRGLRASGFSGPSTYGAVETQ